MRETKKKRKKIKNNEIF